jgi:ABC-type amino acid transport substrate-binding protein
MKPFFYTLSTVLLCLSANANATGPRVSASLFEPPVNEIFTLDFPQVLSAESANSGVATEIIKAALKAENVENTLTPLPLQTMLSYYLNEENALAIAGHDLNLTTSETKNVISIPILRLKESYFYYRPKHDTLNWKGDLNAFKGLTLGIHKDDASADYQKANIKIIEDRLEQRISGLIAGKIDVVREADFTIAKILKTNFATQEKDVIRLEPSAGEALILVAFNKKNPKGIALSKQFSQGLAKIIASGEYEAILQKQAGEQSKNYFLPLKK